MKKILLVLILFGLLSVPFVGGAIITQPPRPQTHDICCGAGTVMDRVINWMFAFLLIFAVIMVIVAAFYFVTASGNPEAVTKARHFVIYALIGILVGFMAKGLVKLVEMIASGETSV